MYNKKIVSKYKLIILTLITTLITLLSIGCDKGVDSVDFDYYLDANDNRIVHFIAKGQSDYGAFDYSWNFGDGSAGTGKEISHTFDSFNTFTVILTAAIKDSNIETTIQKQIKLEKPTITDLDFDYYMDANDSRIVHFTANGKSDYGTLDYEWSFGDGNGNTGKSVSHTYSTFNKYTIILTATIKDSDIKTTITKEIELNKPSITDLDFDYYMNANDSRVVNFIVKDKNFYSVIEYKWDFGDGSVGTGKEINHAFSTFNKYTVTLTATIKDSNVVATKTKEIDLNKPVIINLDFEYYIDANNRLTVHFIADGKSDYGTLDYEWDFGDGDGDVGKRISHTFGTYGKYTIMLTATIRESNIETTVIKDIELEKPVIKDVDFDYYIDANDRLAVHFIAKGKSDYGNIEYSWNFGDGAVGSGKDITHTYASFSIFTVILTATIEDSDVETTIQKNIKLEKPTITDLDFEVVPDKKNPRIYNFKATSKSDYGNAEYEWDFGDGMTTSGQNVQYSFEYFGDYEVSLKAKLEEYENITSITKKYVKVAAPSITRLDIYAVQDNDNPFLYHFKPIADASWGTLEYEWSFGDGKYAYDEEVQNIYTKYSSYIVKVKAIIKETGTVREFSKTIEVEQPVFKNYEITHNIDANDPLKVYFTIENKDGEEDGDMSQQDSFQWEFGDGNTSNGLRVTYRYESYGEKTVYVTLRTAQQTQKTLTKTFTLETPAITNIKPSGKPSYKAGNIVQYNVIADSEFNDEIEYKWEFSDGTTKTGRIVERDMSYWPDTEPGTPGQIKEEVYITASIPRLNVKVRDLHTIYVTRPDIENVAINCTYDNISKTEYICNPYKDGKTPNITGGGGGELEYEWVFNGQTYTGANQRFVLTTDAEYKIYLTAKIEDTNIVRKPSPYPAQMRLDKPVIYCSNDNTVTSDHEDALKLICRPEYDKVYNNVSVTWEFEDGTILNSEDRNSIEYQAKKAGVYKVKMTLKPSNASQQVVETDTLVSFKPTAWGSSSFSGDKQSHCGGMYKYGKFYIHNNFALFNQEDFTITNTIIPEASCECGDRKSIGDNIWYVDGQQILSGCWGNINSVPVQTTICKKGTTDKENECVSNF